MRISARPSITALACVAVIGTGAAPAAAGSKYSAKKCFTQEQKIVKKYSKKLAKTNLTAQQRAKIGKKETKAVNALMKNHGCVFRG